MPSPIFSNNVSTTLGSPVTTTTQTSITLASAANLPATIPAGSYFAVTLNDAATRQVFEIVYASGISGATLTGCLRGQENTTAQTWLVGDYAFAAVTAGELGQFSALEIPLPVADGGTGTATPSLVEGVGIEIDGNFPNQTVANSGVLSLKGQTGNVTITGSGGITPTTPSTGTVNIDGSALVDDITSDTLMLDRTGQSVDIELPSGFVGQTITEIFYPTPAEINDTYTAGLPSVLPAGNWAVVITCIGFGLGAGTEYTISMQGSSGTFPSSASLNGDANSRTLIIAGTAVGEQQPTATLFGASVSYAAGSTSVFLIIQATRNS